MLISDSAISNLSATAQKHISYDMIPSTAAEAWLNEAISVIFGVQNQKASVVISKPESG
jgi:hypothetical protein